MVSHFSAYDSLSAQLSCDSSVQCTGRNRRIRIDLSLLITLTFPLILVAFYGTCCFSSLFPPANCKLLEGRDRVVPMPKPA